jgi:hypothetical protein
MKMLTRYEHFRDLIYIATKEAEADGEGKFTPLVMVCWFEDGSSELIRANSTCGQARLNGILEEHGQPMGVIGTREGSDELSWYLFLIYEEYATDSDLTDIAYNFLESVAALLKMGRQFGEKAAA